MADIRQAGEAVPNESRKAAKRTTPHAHDTLAVIQEGQLPTDDASV
jgi:hypothetical protein